MRGLSTRQQSKLFVGFNLNIKVRPAKWAIYKNFTFLNRNTDNNSYNVIQGPCAYCYLKTTVDI